MNQVFYLLNAPVMSGIDLSNMKEDVVPFITPQLPASWNQPRTRVRIRVVGDFQLAKPGDLFFRKLWMGKTQLTFCSAQAIVPNQGRNFQDEHDFCLYGDNLHAIFSRHHTGIGPTSYIGNQEGSSLTTEQNRSAVPATMEISRNDAPLIVDGNWNNFYMSFYGVSDEKIVLSVREFSVEQTAL